MYTFDRLEDFLGSEKHVICRCPIIYMVEILLQSVTVCYIIDFAINPCIVSKTYEIRF